ncbi:MAG: histidine phosphatase family protein [Gammaproteobacteria bacterium]
MANRKGWKALTISSWALIAVLITGIIVIYWWSSATVILIVRHGERDDAASCTPPTNNPPLSTAGQARADALAHVSEDTVLQAIYASDFCRTQQTVQPIANQLGLAVTPVNQHATDGSPDVDALVAHVKSNNEGQKILIAGHSDTVPLIIEKLGGGAVNPIGGAEFDNLYVVTIFKWWFIKRTRVVRLKYLYTLSVIVPPLFPEQSCLPRSCAANNCPCGAQGIQDNASRNFYCACVTLSRCPK